MTTIGWDLRLGEFSLWDHYYYNLLLNSLESQGLLPEPVLDWTYLEKYKTLVINYPEKYPGNRDRTRLLRAVHLGLHLVCTGYYRNEDNVAMTLNRIIEPVGIHIRSDVVLDPEHCLHDDPYFVNTRSLHNPPPGIQELVFPCTCSLHPINRNVVPLVYAEFTARCDPPPMFSENPKKSPLLAATVPYGQGYVTVIGTCVFWDNYSIHYKDNLAWILAFLQSPQTTTPGQIEQR